MKSLTILQFPSLSDLAGYVKVIPVSAYLINTQHLTLKAQLSTFDVAIAVEQFAATPLATAPATAQA